MLYLIGTDRLGRVVEAIPCPKGLNQAIYCAAFALTRPGEDAAVTADVLADVWFSAVAFLTDRLVDLTHRERRDMMRAAVVWRRAGFSTRYGLVAIGDHPTTT
jgi:hypothetical protein